jgi:hypothetical protein
MGKGEALLIIIAHAGVQTFYIIPPLLFTKILGQG